MCVTHTLHIRYIWRPGRSRTRGRGTHKLHMCVTHPLHIRYIYLVGAGHAGAGGEGDEVDVREAGDVAVGVPVCVDVYV